MGISSLSNRKMFISYHQPSFLYRTDTMYLNTSAAVYLNIGVMPATAQRDVQILGLH